MKRVKGEREREKCEIKNEEWGERERERID